MGKNEWFVVSMLCWIIIAGCALIGTLTVIVEAITRWPLITTPILVLTFLAVTVIATYKGRG